MPPFYRQFFCFPFSLNASFVRAFLAHVPFTTARFGVFEQNSLLHATNLIGVQFEVNTANGSTRRRKIFQFYIIIFFFFCLLKLCCLQGMFFVVGSTRSLMGYIPGIMQSQRGLNSFFFVVLQTALMLLLFEYKFFLFACSLSIWLSKNGNRKELMHKTKQNQAKVCAEKRTKLCQSCVEKS